MASNQCLASVTKRLLQPKYHHLTIYCSKYTAPTVKQAVYQRYNVRDINHPQVKKVDLSKV